MKLQGEVLSVKAKGSRLEVTIKTDRIGVEVYGAEHIIYPPNSTVARKAYFVGRNVKISLEPA